MEENGYLNNNQNDDVIVVEYGSGFNKILIFGAVLFIVISLIMLAVFVINGGTVWVGSVIFSLFGLICTVLYLIIKNIRIIYENGSIRTFNMLGKEEKYRIENIQNALEQMSGKIKLVMNNGKSVKFTAEMLDYVKLKAKLMENGIVIKRQDGAEAPRGW